MLPTPSLMTMLSMLPQRTKAVSAISATWYSYPSWTTVAGMTSVPWIGSGEVIAERSAQVSTTVLSPVDTMTFSWTE